MSAVQAYKVNLIKARKQTKNKILFKLPGDRKPCQFDLGIFNTFENVNTSIMIPLFKITVLFGNKSPLALI